MPYDVRAIANYVLERAKTRGISLTNLSLNKVLFFVKAHSLAHAGAKLFTEQAEAWEYGPVYQEIYRQFRKFGPNTVTERATRLDFSTGKQVPFCEAIDGDTIRLIDPVIDFYLALPAWKLVEMSHEPGGPWHMVWNHQSASNPGMLILDELIAKSFRQKERAAAVSDG